MKSLISALVTSASLFAAVPAIADARADIEARYAGLKVAMDERDDKAIKTFLTRDFQSIDISGEAIDAEAMITRLAMIPVDPAMKSESTVVSVTIDGATAKAVQTRSMKMQREGRDGQMHQGEFITSSNDAWVQQGSTWLLKTSEVQEMVMKRDGVEMRRLKKGDPIPPRGGRGMRGEGRGGPPPEGAPPPPAPAG